ncbi:hypothetical protein ACKF11_13815 [Methylobacillus sp. Pita2]|uniref:hypothetical protein n=1 Tax=Methylobacillus sp. Pita2 TaxID=3383245 RepID=UPI0038B6AB75
MATEGIQHKGKPGLNPGQLSPASGLDVIGSPQRALVAKDANNSIVSFEGDSADYVMRGEINNKILSSSICSQLLNRPELENALIMMVKDERSLTESRNGKLSSLANSGFGTIDSRPIDDAPSQPSSMKVR